MRISLLILFISACVSSGLSQTFKTAVEYNDYIVAEQDKIGEKIMEFNTLIEDLNSTKELANNKIQEVLKVIKSSIAAIEKLSDFEGNKELRQTTLDLFKYYEKCIGVYYVEIINIIYAAELTDDSTVQLQKIMDKITSEEKILDENFSKAQNNFAKAHNFQLIDNELQKEIDK